VISSLALKAERYVVRMDSWNQNEFSISLSRASIWAWPMAKKK
jgi:hypothetical protein